MHICGRLWKVQYVKESMERLAAQWLGDPETISTGTDEEHAFFDWIFTVRVCSEAFQLLHLVSEPGGMKYDT